MGPRRCGRTGFAGAKVVLSASSQTRSKSLDAVAFEGMQSTPSRPWPVAALDSFLLADHTVALEASPMRLLAHG